MSSNKELAAALVLRAGVCATFAGHGLFAFLQKPEWILYLMAVGFPEETARALMPAIGALDLVVAALVLFKPLRIVLAWAVFWALLTAIIRPIAGLSFLEFVERGANWTAPLALLWLRGLPKNRAEWLN